jgi:hypothetical protein
MKPAELYKLWAPDDSIWSNWAKPVLFADHAYDDLPLSSSADWKSLNVSWASLGDSNSAIVLDLSGAFSVWYALALAQRGFRPVPLFNGAPGPMMGGFPLVDVSAVVSALHAVAEDLMSVQLSPTSPPVFLLDSNRFDNAAFADPGRYDNRWWVFPQDFPSANYLLSQNIRSVVLVQKNSAGPQRDLAHILVRWQEAGIQIMTCGTDDQTQPAVIHVGKPGNFKTLWYRAMVLAGLRRNSTGGFGAMIPEPSSGGGFG